jgi:hypothetical protein
MPCHTVVPADKSVAANAPASATVAAAGDGILRREDEVWCSSPGPRPVDTEADADRKFCGAGVSTGTVDTGFRLSYCALLRLEQVGHPQVGDRQLELADVELRGAQVAKPSGAQ